MSFTKCCVAACHAWFTDLTVSCTQVHGSRLRINKWAGLEGCGVAQQLWRQIFPLWISKAGNRCVWRGDRGVLCPLLWQVSSLNLFPPSSLSLCQTSSLNPTFQLPRPPVPSWSSHKPSHLRDAIASLPFPPAHPCSTGKKSIIFFYSLTLQTHWDKALNACYT